MVPPSFANWDATLLFYALTLFFVLLFDFRAELTDNLWVSCFYPRETRMESGRLVIIVYSLYRAFATYLMLIIHHNVHVLTVILLVSSSSRIMMLPCHAELCPDLPEGVGLSNDADQPTQARQTSVYYVFISRRLASQYLGTAHAKCAR